MFNRFLVKLVCKVFDQTTMVSTFKSDSHLPEKIDFYLFQWKSFKNDEKCFLFHDKSSFS